MDSTHVNRSVGELGLQTEESSSAGAFASRGGPLTRISCGRAVQQRTTSWRGFSASRSDCQWKLSEWGRRRRTWFCVVRHDWRTYFHRLVDVSSGWKRVDARRRDGFEKVGLVSVRGIYERGTKKPKSCGCLKAKLAKVRDTVCFITLLTCIVVKCVFMLSLYDSLGCPASDEISAYQDDSMVHLASTNITFIILTQLY